jgi:copper/silver efflux system protein
MTSTGARTPLALRIASPDPERLGRLAVWARSVVAALPGVRSASAESATDQVALRFDADAPAMARLQVDPARVRATLDLLLAEGEIGRALVHGRVVPVALVSDSSGPRRAQGLRDVTVRASAGAPAGAPTTSSPGGGSGQPVALGLLGRPVFAPTPAMVRTDDGQLVADIYVDLAPDADLLDVVARGRRALETAGRDGVELVPGERLEWTGQYQLMVSGRRRLLVVAPLVLLSMLGLLFWQFRSLSEAAIVLISVPFALVGSFWTLFLLRYPLSAPVWVGLLSTVGLAMQMGVVMVVYIDDAFHRRRRQGLIRNRADIVAAHAEGTVRRLRPKLMTIAAMAASLLPLLWADGAGAEIMKRVAAPMIGGLATSAFLTLEVLPVVYTIWRHRQLVRARGSRS